MHRAMWMYVPALLFLAASLALPRFGPNVIGSMSRREFASLLAFWSTVIAVGWRVGWWVVRAARAESRRDSPPPQGFDVIVPADRPADRR